MKLARVAKALDINERTLKLWIGNPALAPYFSAPARIDNPSREMDDDDLIVANTIRKLREGMSNHNVDWQAIADRLNSGHRDDDLPPTAAVVDSRASMLAQHSRTVGLTLERDAALKRINDLETALAEERRQHMADNERLLRELSDARVAAANVELEMYKSGRIKPSK